jgi:hypothetical protein
MQTILIIGSALALILLFLITIRPHGFHKSRQSKYSRADLLSLGMAAVIASIILFVKYR